MPSTADAPLSLDELYARAQRQLAHLEYRAALETATLAKTRGADGHAWLLVVADASRALGKLTDAADAYDAAARSARGTDAVEAGYSAAYLRFHDLHDPKAALVSLEAARVDAAGSHLEERGLVLHIHILDALNMRAEAQPLARRYLERFPRGDAAEQLRRH